MPVSLGETTPRALTYGSMIRAISHASVTSKANPILGAQALRERLQHVRPGRDPARGSHVARLRDRDLADIAVHVQPDRRNRHGKVSAPTRTRTTSASADPSMSFAYFADRDPLTRWTAAAMLAAEQQFRKIIGYRDLATLVIAVEVPRRFGQPPFHDQW
jgi:hypothetical protein